MKLHTTTQSDQNIFTGYGDNYVMINQIRHEQSLILFPDEIIENWPVQSFEHLQAEHFDCLLSFKPEIVLLGTGAQINFPEHSLLSKLIQSGIGFETMDTKATCRTYNILTEEGRRVAAAIII